MVRRLFLIKRRNKMLDYVINLLQKLFGSVENVVVEVEENVVPDFEAMPKMTKAQIEEDARQYGIELDRRKTKANMIQQYKDMVGA
jgi:hypothetical protein